MQTIQKILIVTFIVGLGIVYIAEENTEETESNIVVTSGIVTDVIDGDTFKYCPTKDDPCSEDEWVEVDLWGVDAPELTPEEQFFSKKASQYLLDELLKQTVILEQMNTDDAAKPMVKVLIVNHPNSNFNVHLLMEGHGWSTVTDEDDVEDVVSYREAEKFAQKRKLGLWREIEPVAPWNWLKMHADELEPDQPTDTNSPDSE
ncbi:MAG: thermonuclease family protein [Gammaproteobacteria bacterium]|nr:thermonuclease family protein [Gammaproteobacteria bacterium]